MSSFNVVRVVHLYGCSYLHINEQSGREPQMSRFGFIDVFEVM
jgi:hypothetical protein